MKAKRVVSLLVASSLCVVSLAGCDIGGLFGGKDKDAVKETCESYVAAVIDGKIKNSKKLVVDEEDAFDGIEMDDRQAELIKAVLDASTYEVDGIEVKKDSASADIVFSMPDLESIADEEYSFDDFIAAVGDIEDMTEETVTFELSKDGEDWLIEGDSTADLADFFLSIGEGIEFGGNYESIALELIDTYIAYLIDGDLEAASAMTDGETLDIAAELEEFGEFGDDIYASAVQIISNYFSRLDYTSEVSSSDENVVTVSITGQAPDVTEAEDATSDPEIMVPIYADIYEGYLNGTGDGNMYSVYSELFDVIANAIGSASLVDYEQTVTVTFDENGEGTLSDLEDFMPDFDIASSADYEEIFPAAMQLLLDEGRITQEQYDSVMGVTGDQPSNITMDVTETGNDYYTASFGVYTGYLGVEVRTMAYYNEGDIFNYDIIIDGQPYAEGAIYEIPDDYCDAIDLTLMYEGSELAEGVYEFVVYDQGAGTSTVLAHVTITVGEATSGSGSSAGTGTAPAFVTSMTYDAGSSDFYSFHFVDGNDIWLDGNDHISSNEGVVHLVARTWDYYSAGTVVAYDVYRDGAYVESGEVVSDTNSNDTFRIDYEPAGGLTDGDYVFVIHEPDSPNTVLVTAYATVETEN